MSLRVYSEVHSIDYFSMQVDLPKMLRIVAGYSADTPALLVRGPADVNVLQGDTVILSATYCGQPEPQVRWLRAVSIAAIIYSLCGRK